ncbi:MAG: hypothetical protein U5L08_01310 [Xanthomonadales bacterium]|nr:hypothetical protein [Xanthomonadales bacterium]
MNGHVVLLLLAFGLPLAGQAETRIDGFADDEFQINTYELNDQRIPAVAVDAEGNSLVVWQSQGQAENGWDVFARRLDANGEMQAPELRVNEFAAGRQESQHVTALPSDDFVVAWNGASRRGVSQGIHARRLDNDGSPLGSDRPVGGLSEELHLLPRVAATADDGYLVTWEGRGLYDDTFSIPGQFMADDGTADGPLIRISQRDETQQRRVDLARNPDGDYMVVWQSSGQDGDSWGVFGRCLASDGSGNGEFRINQSTKGAQGRPRVAALGRQGFAVVWHDNRGRSTFEYRRVMLRHFDQQCQPLGDERQVNQFDQGIQDLPDIAAGTDGSHVVVWHSLPEDFEDQGIFARRIDRSGAFHGAEIRVHQEREAFQDFPGRRHAARRRILRGLGVDRPGRIGVRDLRPPLRRTDGSDPGTGLRRSPVHAGGSGFYRAPGRAGPGSVGRRYGRSAGPLCQPWDRARRRIRQRRDHADGNDRRRRPRGRHGSRQQRGRQSRCGRAARRRRRDDELQAGKSRRAFARSQSGSRRRLARLAAAGNQPACYLPAC